MPPSITAWNRLEPRPRAPSLSLAARVRDPLWMLARQAQFEEFRAADSGSPAFAQLAASITRFGGWRVDGETQVRPLTPADPLEDLVASEPFAPDLATRVEAGQALERLLADAVSSVRRRQELIDALRRAYPLPRTPDASAGPPLFSMRPTLARGLSGRTVSAGVVKAFQGAGVPLSSNTTIEGVGERTWRLSDPDYARIFVVESLEPAERALAVHVGSLEELAGDREAFLLLAVCEGRAIDGWSIYRAAANNLAILPAAIAGAEGAALSSAVAKLQTWLSATYGALGIADPPAWKPERLEYRLQALADGPGRRIVLAADPGRDGDFDWDAFDLRRIERGRGGVEKLAFSVIPGHVRFAGMPNARFWDFETGTTPFGEIQPDKRDLGKLVMMDFMLVHGNDWFTIPLEQPVGSLCAIDRLIVRDVFGVEMLIERADAAAAAPRELWTMFSTANENGPNSVAGFFIVPPSPGAAVQAGPTLEDVRFLRDEMANLVWGVEHTTENGAGDPTDAHERAITRALAAPAPAPAAGAPPLRYVLQSAVPENWFPFVPVLSSPATGNVLLERQLLTSPAGAIVQPAGRILRPSSLGASPFRVCEEEVPREGVRVVRVVVRSRWIDGSTHLWIIRRKLAGTGEGSSGLRFDQAVPTDLPPSVPPP